MNSNNKQNYSREQIIALCERSSVSQDNWRNRDSASAQKQVGELLMLLKAGCDFTVDENTSHQTISVRVTYDGFNAFEGGEKDTGYFYLPTDERLKNRQSKDWY